MIQSQAIRIDERHSTLLEVASTMLGLNEKCLLFLEISSELGDPMYFSFKKDVTIGSLG